MLSINLSAEVEKHLIEIVQDNYNGNLQEAIKSFLRLQEKYGWKEQLLQDVKSIRSEIRRTGGIKSEVIDSAIKRYRNRSGKSNG